MSFNNKVFPARRQSHKASYLSPPKILTTPVCREQAADKEQVADTGLYCWEQFSGLLLCRSHRVCKKFLNAIIINYKKWIGQGG